MESSSTPKIKISIRKASVKPAKLTITCQDTKCSKCESSSEENEETELGVCLSEQCRSSMKPLCCMNCDQLFPLVRKSYLSPRKLNDMAVSLGCVTIDLVATPASLTETLQIVVDGYTDIQVTWKADNFEPSGPWEECTTIGYCVKCYYICSTVPYCTRCYNEIKASNLQTTIRCYLGTMEIYECLIQKYGWLQDVAVVTADEPCVFCDKTSIEYVPWFRELLQSGEPCRELNFRACCLECVNEISNVK
jgi:hypothetical protein